MRRRPSAIMSLAAKDALSKGDPPHDAYNLTYIIFFTLGVGTLFSWNAFISAANYFGERLCHSRFDAYMNDFSICYTAANVVSLALMIKYGAFIPRKLKIVGSFVFYTFIFIFITVCVLLPDLSADFVYFSTAIACILSGGATAGMSGGIFGMVGQFPGIYIQAVMSGQGLSGLAVALVGMLASLASATTPAGCGDDDDGGDGDDDTCSTYDKVDWGSFAYFVVAVIIFLTCVVGYLALEQLPLAHYYDQELSKRNQGDLQRPSQSQAAVNGGDEEANVNPAVESLLPNGGDSVNDDVDHVDGRLRDAAALSPPASGSSGEPAEMSALFAKIRSEAIGVWLTFAVTLSVFPSITALIEPEDGCAPFSKTLYVPFMFVMFNLFDLIGRTAAGYIQIIPDSRILTAAVCRLVWIPLFALCNVSGSRLDVLFGNRFWPSLFMAFMALSNGYVSTLCMIYAPRRVQPQDAETAGTIMIFMLTSGLFSGSLLSYLVLLVVTGKA